MRIIEVAPTDLFCGSLARPLQIVRVSLVNDGADMIHDRAAIVTVSVHGAMVTTPEPTVVTELLRGERRTIEVGVEIAAPMAAGSPVPVTAVAQAHPGRWEARGEVTVAQTGWTMWMISHFHYDPVWWNTQGRFTENWPLLPAEDGSPPEVRTAFDLVRLHLEAARTDPDYKFVVAEIDYLKPFFDAHPADRADLHALIAAGRIEVIGGSYNEPNTNLICAESAIRNAVLGLAYQHEILGADPATAWMLDAFGFDPSYPGLMAAAGLADSSWARGPFHQWGPPKTGDGNRRMQFPSEFEWLSPDGSGLLTSYMPNHYSAGWITQQAADLATAERHAYAQFRQLAPVAATQNVLLPVGGDHVVPSRWATQIHRHWRERYVWPRFVTAVPSEFFAAVRADAAAAGVWFLPQTRDMNPIYTGKDVSYIDTKQAQREAEIAVLDGERLATLAWLAGASYPAASVDKAWRLLAFGGHHDAITGTESDQVYLDLLAGWREAFERGAAARDEAMRHLAALADTRGTFLRTSPAVLARGDDPPEPAAVPARGDDPQEPAAVPAGTRAIVVFNTLSWVRSGMVTTALEFTEPGTASVRLADHDGRDRGYLADGITCHPDGTLATISLTFRAADVPAVGYRTFLAVPEPAAGAGVPAGHAGWQRADGLVIENDALRVAADPAGGALASITDRHSGAELLAGAGNELVLAEEYASHPVWGEGPWLLCPTGKTRGSAGVPAKVRAERSPVGSRLVTEFTMDDLRVTGEALLWDGADRVEFRTHVDGSIGQDRLLRVRFAANVPGGLPVYQTGLSVIGRTPGPADSDVAEHGYTLDNPAHEWFGVGSTARVAVTGPDGEISRQAIGVAEIIVPAAPAADSFPPRDPGAGDGYRQAVRDLVVALARQGVTATCTVPDGPRYGDISVDSNLPDVRIALGGPAQNAFTARVLAASGMQVAEAVDSQLAASGSARVWVPAVMFREQAFAAGVDLRGTADLPVLIVTGDDLSAAITALVADLDDAEISVRQPGRPAASGQDADGGQAHPAEPSVAGHSVALLNRGLPGGLVTPAGELYISLMRSCSSWPAGIWLDGDRRTVPDGTSFAWQHWSHTFEYALAAGPGDWRTAGFAQAGQEYNHRLLACQADVHGGILPASASLASVTPADAALMALKPRGNPVAPHALPDPADGITARLRDLRGSGAAYPAAIRLFTGIDSASVTSLLEADAGEPADCADGAVTVTVPGRGVVTVAVRAEPVAAPSGGRAGGGQPPEPAQPVFTRYWLHGKGPAPAGNLPVAVHLAPNLLALRAGERGTLTLTVACGTEPASGTVTLDVPDSLHVKARPAAAAGPGQDVAGAGGSAALSYRLTAGGYAAWELTVMALTEAASGTYYLVASIADAAGQVLHDAAEVTVGGERPPEADLPLAQQAARLERLARAEQAQVTLTIVGNGVELAPGQQGTITARLANHTRSPLRCEAQLITPLAGWPAGGPWSSGFTAAPGEVATLDFTVAIPADARPGERWWALVKLMYFGRLRYSEAVWIGVVP